MPNLAQQAQAELGSLNKKIIEDVPEKILKSGKPIYIFNVGPTPWIKGMASLGPMTVPECHPGKKYSAPLIIQGIVRETYPDSESTQKMRNRFEDGEDIARDFLGEGKFQSKDQGFRQVGVFIAAGETPTEAELAEANRCLDEWRDKQIQEADNFWNAGPLQYANIVAEHRAAAIARGVDREWVKPIKAMTDCPGCGEKIKPGVSKHALPHGCGIIVNREKYDKEFKAGLWPQDQPQKTVHVG